MAKRRTTDSSDESKTLNWRSKRVDASRRKAKTTLAAGGVLWRFADHPMSSDRPAGALNNDSNKPLSPDDVEVAVVHRPRYGDWSLPKGKVDHGESLPQTATREIWEETGFHSRLGKFLGKVSYPITKHSRKCVYYWSARVLDGSFTDNSEVDSLEWLSIPNAQKRVSYPLDQRVLRKFAHWPVADTTILLVRHARAGDRAEWDGEDSLRPLDDLGLTQAEAIASQSLVFGPQSIVTADRLRCEQTIAPLAKKLGLVPTIEPFFSEEGYLAAPEETERRFQRVIDAGSVAVVCSQGGVIPHLVEWLSDRDGIPVNKTATKKAGTWVLSFSNGALVGADLLVSPLPLT